MFNPEALMIGISLCPLPNKDNYRYLKKTVYVGGASEEGERNVRIFLFFLVVLLAGGGPELSSCGQWM